MHGEELPYDIWAGIDTEIVHGAATAGLGRLALGGCTTSTDHPLFVGPDGVVAVRCLGRIRGQTT